jgi:predicted transporter
VGRVVVSSIKENIVIVSGLSGIFLVILLLYSLVVEFTNTASIPLLAKINIVLIVIASVLIILGVHLTRKTRKLTQDLNKQISLLKPHETQNVRSPKKVFWEKTKAKKNN